MLLHPSSPIAILSAISTLRAGSCTRGIELLNADMATGALLSDRRCARSQAKLNRSTMPFGSYWCPLLKPFGDEQREDDGCLSLMNYLVHEAAKVFTMGMEMSAEAQILDSMDILVVALRVIPNGMYPKSPDRVGHTYDVKGARCSPQQ